VQYVEKKFMEIDYNMLVLGTTNNQSGRVRKRGTLINLGVQKKKT
jgi:hypothetical protein